MFPYFIMHFFVHCLLPWQTHYKIHLLQLRYVVSVTESVLWIYSTFLHCFYNWSPNPKSPTPLLSFLIFFLPLDFFSSLSPLSSEFLGYFGTLHHTKLYFLLRILLLMKFIILTVLQSKTSYIDYIIFDYQWIMHCIKVIAYLFL